MSLIKRGNLESRIASRFNSDVVVAKRKNITFNVDEELLERLDNVVNVFNEKDGATTRNAVIEDAILGYVEEAEDFFEKQNVHEDTQNISEKNDVDYDTAVFPSINENFSKVFIGEHQWYYVRIAEQRVEHIKYIALYRGAPVSAITHVAEVVDISAPNENNKRAIKLKEPVALSQPVRLGEAHVNSVRKLFYTTLDKLKSVETVDQLIK